VCSQLDVDGIRGDIVATRGAKALVALEGRIEVRAAGSKRSLALLPAAVSHGIYLPPGT
jgi:Mg-chelatase subunit ChlI